MNVADIVRGLERCREATVLPWRDAGDMFAAEGPFPSWYPEELIDRDGGREQTRFFDTRESRKEDVAFVVTATELLPDALEALKRIHATLNAEGSISLDDFERILATPSPSRN